MAETKTTGDLERIIAQGNHPVRETGENTITCADGFTMSVIAGTYAYCSPRPGGFSTQDPSEDYAGPYTHVEVGFPSERPEPWEPIDGDLYWSQFCEDTDKPTDTVYGYVPVALVRHLVKSHGGQA